LTYQAPISE